jgi:hypothetical protein
MLEAGAQGLRPFFLLEGARERVNVAIKALLLIVACVLMLGAVWSTLHGYPPPPPAIEATEPTVD